jgi:hypothetical protein
MSAVLLCRRLERLQVAASQSNADLRRQPQLSAQADIALCGDRFICPMLSRSCPRRRTSPCVAANSFAQLSRQVHLPRPAPNAKYARDIGGASKFWVSASLVRRRLKTTTQTGTNSINRVGINRFPSDFDLLRLAFPKT